MVDDRKHTEADLTRKRYPGFVLENQEKGRANAERRKAISKAAV